MTYIFTFENIFFNSFATSSCYVPVSFTPLMEKIIYFLNNFLIRPLRPPSSQPIPLETTMTDYFSSKIIMLIERWCAYGGRLLRGGEAEGVSRWKYELISAMNVFYILFTDTFHYFITSSPSSLLSSPIPVIFLILCSQRKIIVLIL